MKLLPPCHAKVLTLTSTLKRGELLSETYFSSLLHLQDRLVVWKCLRGEYFFCFFGQSDFIKILPKKYADCARVAVRRIWAAYRRHAQHITDFFMSVLYSQTKSLFTHKRSALYVKIITAKSIRDLVRNGGESQLKWVATVFHKRSANAPDFAADFAANQMAVAKDFILKNRQIRQCGMSNCKRWVCSWMLTAH